MKRFTLALPAAWMAVFLVLPLLIVLAVAFAEATAAVPPFALGLNLGNFAALFADGFYLGAFARSFIVAGVSSVLCLAVGYPMGFAITRAPANWRGALLTLVILPFWTGFLLRLTAWIGLLREDGWINAVLGLFGLGPAEMLYTPGAMYVGIAYCYLPFMILPLYARLSARDVALEEAAADLGAGPWRVFWRITWPLSRPGVVAGLLLVFVPAMGEFVIPELLGGPAAETLGRVLWGEFFANRDWPMASALAVAMLLVLMLPVGVWQWKQGGER